MDRIVKIYRWTVKHKDFETVTVEAEDKLRALMYAGMQWKTPWTPIARQCMVTRGALVSEYVVLPARPAIDVKKKRGDIKSGAKRKGNMQSTEPCRRPRRV